MSVEIIVALVSGVVTILSVILGNRQTNKDIDAKLERDQAVTEAKLEELTREVRVHNNFASRIPVIEEQVKVINHRIDDTNGRISGYHHSA